MKSILRKVFIVIFILLGEFVVFAKPHPPAPVKKTAATTSIPPPPGVSIDDSILFLLILGLFMGMYVVCKYQLKNKSSNLI
jgi:uncharacterized protein YneF (UPF0154 family)